MLNSFNFQVEQLHKIFKLCGSPAEEYWRKSKLPHATMFKPQHPYESSLRERCKDIPTTALDLIETFLSVEPYQRGTASSALISQVTSMIRSPISHTLICHLTPVVLTSIFISLC